jgi:hypothetical protein
MDITGVVARAVMSRGTNPLVYLVEWTEGGRVRSGHWPDAAVEEVDPTPLPPAQRPMQLGELGAIMAGLQKGNPQ